MRLLHKNVTVDIPDDDPRVQVIELMVFGRSTLPLYAGPERSAPVPAEKEAPAVEVPPAFREFWTALPKENRAELVLLSQGPQQVDGLEGALRPLTYRTLQGLHYQTNLVARRHRIGQLFQRVGHDRKHRCFRISDEHAAWVRALSS